MTWLGLAPLSYYSIGELGNLDKVGVEDLFRKVEFPPSRSLAGVAQCQWGVGRRARGGGVGAERVQAWIGLVDG